MNIWKESGKQTWMLGGSHCCRGGIPGPPPPHPRQICWRQTPVGTVMLRRLGTWGGGRKGQSSSEESPRSPSPGSCVASTGPDQAPNKNWTDARVGRSHTLTRAPVKALDTHQTHPILSHLGAVIHAVGSLTYSDLPPFTHPNPTHSSGPDSNATSSLKPS